GVAECAAAGARRRARIPAGAVKQAEAERDGIDPRRVSRFVHEAFDRPIGPAGADRAQITRAEGAVREIVRESANPLRSHIVPMIGPPDRELVEGYVVYPLVHKARHRDLRGPAGGGMMLHRRHFAAFTESNAQRLD